MRHPCLLTGLLLLLMPAAAHAQVTIDLRALEALPSAPPTLPPPAAHQVLRRVPAGPAETATLPVPPVPPGATPAPAPTPATAAASAQPAPKATTAPATPATGAATASTATSATAPPATPAPPAAPAATAPPAATLPTAPPAVVALAPIPPPVAPTPARPPTPPPVSPTAGTTAHPETAGLRLEFKSDQSDLSPDANGAIGELVKATPSGETVTFNVMAYAAGAAEDPSIARRLSLARGLSVRAALIADGVPSTRIYIRALGAGAGSTDGPPDRVDLTVLGRSGAVGAGAAGAGAAATAVPTVGASPPAATPAGASAPAAPKP